MGCPIDQKGRIKYAVRRYAVCGGPIKRGSTIGCCVIAVATLSWAAISEATQFPPGDGASDEVHVKVKGEIKAKCALEGLATKIDIGELTAPGPRDSRDFPFQLSCNTPFEIKLTSQNGHMRHESLTGTTNGFLTQFIYQIGLSVPIDGGTTIQKTCLSDDLGAGCGEADSGQEIAIDRTANLKISWGPFSGPLIAGKYFDVINLQLLIRN